MTFEYYILNPAGNITALVTSKINKSDYIRVSDEIMRLHPETEQVGFVDFEGEMPKLQMYGGEFCGNATMCAASLFCHLKNLNECELVISVSGAKNPLNVCVSKNADAYECCLLMEKPESIENRTFVLNGKEYNLPLVSFGGISHIISQTDFNKCDAEKILRIYSEKLSFSAMGFMLYDEKSDALTPIVYVKDCNKMFYENSCASGSCAVCAFVAEDELNEKEIILHQPGGTLKAASGKMSDYIRLFNRVEIVNKFIEE